MKSRNCSLDFMQFITYENKKEGYNFEIYWL